MRENEFRDRLRDALGEPPPLPAPQLTPSDGGSRGYPRGMALVAVGLAVLLVLALVASRVVLRPTGMSQPGANGRVAESADTFPCSLAVEAMSVGQNPGPDMVTGVSLGFVNIPGGRFQVDPAATVAGLPVGAITGQDFYSAALKRWVPAPAQAISPDGLSYTYVKLLPAGATYSNATSSEVHVFDVVKNSDRKVWSSSSSVELLSWESAGILVSVTPNGGGTVLLWRINPATGAASPAPFDADPSYLPTSAQPQEPGGGSSISVGSDGHGQYVYRFGSLDKGTKYSIVVVASGKVTTLYSGTVGDSMNFDPVGAYSDGHGLWLGNVGGSPMWLWSQSSGLRGFPVTGLPPAPSGYAFTSFAFMPVGACVPGTFAGVAAPGLPPATTPTPSPSPPQIDWAPLMAKPLNLQPLSSGTPCPVSPQVDLVVTVNGPKPGGPNYGFGQGPVYVSGQIMWYAGSQVMIFLTDPRYTGAVLVRSMRLDGTGSLSLGGQGAATLAGGAIGLAQTSSPPYWGMWIGMVTPSAPGCYGIQFDGTSFSSSAVITVLPGPVPPG
jgi:hypothetical protein